jgi:hypothetical protein
MIDAMTIPAHRFRTVIAASVALAFASWMAPGRGMPINVHAVLWWSIPFASLWLLMVAVSVRSFGKRALWILFAAPLALYWPVWLAFNGIPSCYWHGNCL